MKGGHAIDTVVIGVPKGRREVKAVYGIGMGAMKEALYIVYSPDGVVFADISQF